MKLQLVVIVIFIIIIARYCLSVIYIMTITAGLAIAAILTPGCSWQRELSNYDMTIIGIIVFIVSVMLCFCGDRDVSWEVDGDMDVDNDWEEEEEGHDDAARWSGLRSR